MMPFNLGKLNADGDLYLSQLDNK